MNSTKDANCGIVIVYAEEAFIRCEIAISQSNIVVSVYIRIMRKEKAVCFYDDDDDDEA